MTIKIKSGISQFPGLKNKIIEYLSLETGYMTALEKYIQQPSSEIIDENCSFWTLENEDENLSIVLQSELKKRLEI